MQDDLVSRLRLIRRNGLLTTDKPRKASSLHPVCQEAADRITALEAEVAAARRDALEEAAAVAARRYKTHSDSVALWDSYGGPTHSARNTDDCFAAEALAINQAIRALMENSNAKG